VQGALHLLSGGGGRGSRRVINRPNTYPRSLGRPFSISSFGVSGFRALGAGPKARQGIRRLERALFSVS